MSARHFLPTADPEQLAVIFNAAPDGACVHVSLDPDYLAMVVPDNDSERSYLVLLDMSVQEVIYNA